MDSSEDVHTALDSAPLEGSLPGVHFSLPIKPQVVRLQVTYLVPNELSKACADGFECRPLAFGEIWYSQRIFVADRCLA